MEKKSGFLVVVLLALGGLAYYLKKTEDERPRETVVKLVETKQEPSELKALASALAVPVGKAIVDTLFSYYRKKN